jgi:hypothetical protein
MKNYAGLVKMVLKIILGIFLALFFNYVTIICLELIISKDNPFWDEDSAFWWIVPLTVVWLVLALWLLFRKSSSEKILKIMVGIAFGLILSYMTIVCLEILLSKPNPFMKQHFNFWIVCPIIVVWVLVMLRLMLTKPSFKKMQTQGIENLPESVSALIDAIIDIMKYRHSVRAEVRQELTDHFTDALEDCGDEKERQQRVKKLIDEFGDAKLLGVLLKRAKKRCRPWWRTMVARTFQLVGICFLLLTIHYIYLLFAKPVIRIDYAEKAAQLSQPITDKNKNAAIWYQKAIDAYQEPETLFDKETAIAIHKLLHTEKLYSEVWMNTLTEEQSQRLDQWCKANDQAIFNLLRGTEQTYYSWDYEISKEDGLYAEANHPNCLVLTEILKLLIWQTRENAAEGDCKKAFGDLLNIYRFGMHFKGPKTLFEQYYGNFVQSLAMGTARCIVSNCDVAEKDISYFRKALLGLYEGDTFVVDIQTEKFAILDFMQRIYTDNGSGQGVIIPRQLVELNEKAEFFKALNIPVVSQGFSYGATLVSANRKQMTQEIESLYEQETNYLNYTPYEIHKFGYEEPIENLWDHSSIYRYRYWPLFMLSPQYSNFSEKMYQSKSEVQATLALLAVLQYQKQNGKIPDLLNELVEKGLLKEVPMDPYSDKPLVYKKTDTGFTLYSVCVNFTDDSGIPSKGSQGRPALWGEGGDAVFWPVDSVSSHQ